MKKILGIVVLLVVCAIVAVFSAGKSDYAYVRSLVATDCSNAFLVTRENDRIVRCVVHVENPTKKLIKIASKSPDSAFGYADILPEFISASAGYVFVSYTPDDALQGEYAERSCNYKLVYLPVDKDNTRVFGDGNLNAVVVCKKN